MGRTKTKSNMDLRDYRVEPDNGLYEKIEHRVVRRRFARIGSVVAAVLVVAVGVWLLTQRQPAKTPSVRQIAETSTTNQTLVEDAVHANGGATLSRASDVVEPNPQASDAVVAVPQAETNLTGSGVGAEGGMANFTHSLQPAAQASLLQQSNLVLPQSTVSAPEPEADGLVLNETFEENHSRLSDAGYEEALKGQSDDTVRLHYYNIIMAPNIIVPADGEEENRVFRVTSVVPVTEYSLTIYNRAGRVMFSSHDIQQAWDATYGGSAVPQGAYVWVARFRDSEGDIRQERGTVTVLR